MTRPTFYGTFRESNAVHLEILEPPIAAGVPIELDIFEGPDGTTMLATLEAAREKRLNPMLGDLGAASFVINRHDPKATPEILRVGNYAKYKIGGKYRFGWWIEDVDWTRVAREEKRGEDVKVAGVGAMGCLKHGTWWVEAYTGGIAPADGKWTFPPGTPRGDILLALVEELQARPDGPVIPQVAIGWAEGVDSQGAAWDDDTEAAYEIGYGALETWKQLTALGLESEMTHDLQLRTYVELGRHFEPAPTGNGAVTLLLGRHILEDTHREHDSRKTRLIVKGADGVTITVVDPALEAEIGERREGSISVSNTSDPTTLQRAGVAQLQALILETEAIEIPVAHDADPGGYQPWVDYREGDWIGVERTDGTVEAMRIAGMRLEETVNDYALRLQLNSRRVEALIRLKRMIDALGGGGTGSGTSTGSSIEQGGSSGGGTTSDGRVRVASGDTLGYLYDQVDAGNGIGKAIAGAGGAQQLELRLDLPGAIEDDVPAFDQAAGLWVPRPRGAGGGGGGAATVYRAHASATVTENPHPVVDTPIAGLSLSFTLAAAADCRIRLAIRGDKSTGNARVSIKDGGAMLAPTTNRIFGVRPDGADGTDAQDLYWFAEFIVALGAGDHDLTVEHNAVASTGAISWYDRSLTVEPLG